MKFFKIKKLNIKLNINLSWKQETGDAFILEDNWLNEMDWVSSVVGRWQWTNINKNYDCKKYLKSENSESALVRVGTSNYMP